MSDIMSFNESTGWRTEVLVFLSVALRIAGAFFPEAQQQLEMGSDTVLALGLGTLAVRVKDQ